VTSAQSVVAKVSACNMARTVCQCSNRLKMAASAASSLGTLRCWKFVGAARLVVKEWSTVKLAAMYIGQACIAAAPWKRAAMAAA